MKQFLKGMSHRWGYDGWACRVVGALRPMPWTVCTTRQEAREVRRDLESSDPDLFSKIEVVKVKIDVNIQEIVE